MEISKETKLWMLEKMLKIRRFEEQVYDSFLKNKIPGFAHLYIGEEAVAVGACANLREDDFLTSTHRGHGHLIAKGGKPNEAMAEIFGKETGYCKGRGGTMHIADFSLGMLGANGIVGGGFPIAVGAGWSAQYRGTDQVTVCFFGDGASNEGTFHESINLASVWDLPVIFLCENNQFGISVHQSRHQKVKDIADRAKGYGIPGVIVDGMDVLAVYEACQEAVARARRGEGPTLIEAKTYRFMGHHVGDPGTVYRDKEEIEKWRERCPIKTFREKLFAEGVLTEAEYEAMDKRITEEMLAAVKFAEESPWPDPTVALDGLYV
ncbi:MAG: thiamine pyrophosphate-dependent dehydrogenase E1 component subunit alpha [Limnochordia bacterium]|jgi:pyruvate dehydrogenase E1 component alpha subunit